MCKQTFDADRTPGVLFKGVWRLPGADVMGDVCVLFLEIRSEGAYIDNSAQKSPSCSSLKRFKLINIFSPLRLE